MNIVLGMTEMLIEDTELTEEQRECTDAVMTASQQLMDILTNMLNFSQQFKGEINQVMCDFQISEMVNDVLKIFLSITPDKNVQITTEIAPSLHKTLRGYQEGLSKVLSKLLDNAIKFTKQGKIILRVQAIESFDDKQWLQFEVQDTGIGIASAQQAHLFDIFFQVDGSSTRVYEGVGMGLAVAKMFVENMGGEIGVDSHENQGSTFWFKVPLTEILLNE